MRLSDGATGCTHGPDPAPDGVDVRQAAPVASVSAEAATALAAMACQGDGVTGPRVQLVYAHAAGVTDRYASLLANLQLWAAQVDDVFNLSAAETGGTRHVRYVHDGLCVPTVASVTLTATGDDSFTNTINELRAQGYNRSDRKYLVWVDANVYCGIAQVYNDDRSGQDNPNNGRGDVPGMVARVDNGCWGGSNLVEAHELTHSLGGVQPTAPNATANDHCTDDYDRMCYVDAAGVTMRIVCSATSHENRLDCNHDDYFSTAPTAGSYLATHWNTANSVFLAGGGGTPPPTTVPPPTTTTTTVPPTTTTVPPTTTTTKPPATTTSTTTTTAPPPPASQATRFVQAAYLDLLGRAPSAADTTTWVNLLNGGLSRDAMAGAIVTSTEYRRRVVSNYYQTYLGRAATAGEQDTLLGVISNGWLLEWVQAAILATPEFYGRRGSTAGGYVDGLYSLVLGMTPSATDRAFWVTQLTTIGLDRMTVALAFTTSALAQTQAVNFAYTTFLRRAADAAGATFWTGQLAGGLRQEYMYAFFVGCTEYYARV